MGQLYRFVKPDTVSDADSRSIGASASLAEAINRAALIREAVLKSVIFIGVPRVSRSRRSVLCFSTSDRVFEGAP
jgi:hypothetical protein